MAAILDKYAIKEVADVMFYELDSKGAPSAPVLYIDTAKVTTITQSAEKVDARGGKSNVKLMSWDTNKELTMELTDALFSAKSLGIMFGGTMSYYGDKQEVLKTLPTTDPTLKEDGDYLAFAINGQKMWIAKTLVTAFSYADVSGNDKVDPVPVAFPNWTTMKGKASASGDDVAQPIEFVTFDLLDATSAKAARTSENGVVFNGLTIDIGAEFNANTYYITGDTYARNYQSGKDEFLQFIIPKGKVSAEDVSLTMEADGDPAEFTMTVDCLKAADGTMVKLVKYSLGDDSGATGTLNKGVASVLDDYDAAETENAGWATPVSKITGTSQNDPDYIPA